MGLTKRWISVGVAAFFLGVLGTSGAGATPPVPVAGNWEGTGAHGLPLSFSLARRHGRLVATSIALGAPLTCPANERDAEAVALSHLSYAGPGGASSPGSGAASAVLSGQVPGHHGTAELSGEFASRRSGTFSIDVKNTVGCGWPSTTLTWQVHRARRVHLSDVSWTAALTGPGITAGTVTLTLSGHGRVIHSFHTSFSCVSDTVGGTGTFTAKPAYEFVRPDGSFYSPLHGNVYHGHRTTWSGWLTADGGLSGTLRIYDACTSGIVRAHFQR